MPGNPNMWWTIVAIIVPIIGLAPRNRLQKKWKLLALLCLTTGIIAMPIRSYFETAGNEKTIELLRTQLGTAEQKLLENDTVRKRVIEYGDAAKLNAFGETGLAGKGLSENTPLSQKSELIWTPGENSEKRYPSCDDEGVQMANQIVREHPTFPFSYYVLAMCHRKRGEQEWITHAQKALDILEFTTQVPGHHQHHAIVRKELDDLMMEEQGSIQNQ